MCDDVCLFPTSQMSKTPPQRRANYTRHEIKHQAVLQGKGRDGRTGKGGRRGGGKVGWVGVTNSAVLGWSFIYMEMV